MAAVKILWLELGCWSAVVLACSLVVACPPAGPISPSADADAIAPPAPPPPAPTTPAAADASPSAAGDCQAACNAIAAAGCKTWPDCARVLCNANVDPLFRHYDPACLARAKTPADVRACGADCAPLPDGSR